MSDFETATGNDGRTIAVGALVRHCTAHPSGPAWKVEAIDTGGGRVALRLVDPELPNCYTSFYADRAVLADEGPQP